MCHIGRSHSGCGVLALDCTVYMMYCTIDCIRTLLLYKVCLHRELLPPLLVISILKMQNVISSQVRLAIRGYEDKKIRGEEALPVLLQHQKLDIYIRSWQCAALLMDNGHG